jgi:ATP-dependent protease HslVU (ClpYQ) peptidase subunit
MTCLVGIIQDGKIYIGTDGYATTEDCERKSIICRKLFVSDKYVVAFAGHIRTGQLLYPESGFEFPKDVYQIPNHIYLWLREFEAIGKDELSMAIIQSNFLIATKDKLYEILIDMSVSEIDPECGYTSIGSGTSHAAGSLYTTALHNKYANTEADIIPPVGRIEIALNAAAEFVKNVGPPYQIYSYEDAIRTLKTKKVRKTKPKKKKKKITRTKKAKS